MSVVYYPGYSQVTVQDNLIVQTIASVTQSNPCIVTTVNDHNYVPGMIMTFLIPTAFGMVQLNGKNVQVLSLTPNTLTINLDSTGFTPFAYPSPLPSAYTPPSIIPNGSGPYLPPQPLPYGNQESFEGTTFNAGQPGNLI